MLVVVCACSRDLLKSKLITVRVSFCCLANLYDGVCKILCLLSSSSI